MPLHSHTFPITELSKRLCTSDDYGTYKIQLNNLHTVDDLKMAVTEYTRNADRAILNTDRAILNTDRAILNTGRAILNTGPAILNTGVL
jgi:hypothetical protein